MFAIFVSQPEHIARIAASETIDLAIQANAKGRVMVVVRWILGLPPSI
jgi:hypothetical protein